VRRRRRLGHGDGRRPRAGPERTEVPPRKAREERLAEPGVLARGHRRNKDDEAEAREREQGDAQAFHERVSAQILYPAPAGCGTAAGMEDAGVSCGHTRGRMKLLLLMPGGQPHTLRLAVGAFVPRGAADAHDARGARAVRGNTSLRLVDASVEPVPLNEHFDLVAISCMTGNPPWPMPSRTTSELGASRWCWAACT